MYLVCHAANKLIVTFLPKQSTRSTVALTDSIEACKASFLPRKEVIHPHLPVRIPCYDLTPIIPPTLGRD